MTTEQSNTKQKEEQAMNRAYQVRIEMEQISDSREHAAEQFVRAIQENSIPWTVEVCLPGDSQHASFIDIEPEAAS